MNRELRSATREREARAFIIYRETPFFVLFDLLTVPLLIQFTTFIHHWDLFSLISLVVDIAGCLHSTHITYITINWTYENQTRRLTILTLVATQELPSALFSD